MRFLGKRELGILGRFTAAAFVVAAFSVPLQAATVRVDASSAKGKPGGSGTLKTVVTEEGLKLQGGNDLTWSWALFSRSEQEKDIDPDKTKDEPGKLTEKKFDFTDAGTPKPRNFTGFEAKATTKWSEIEAAGRGKSRRSIGNSLKVNAEIAIKGKIEVPKDGVKVVDAEYEGQALVSDPFYLTPKDIADTGLDIVNFDLFLPFSLGAYSFTDTTDARFSYFFETANGRVDIFDLMAGPLVAPTLGYDAGLDYYLLDDVDDVPDFVTDAPLDMASFALDIQGMLERDGTIGSGFTLGVFLDGLNLDGKVLANGAAIAHGFDGSTGALKFEIGYVPDIPVPAAFWLFASALCLTAGMARRKA